MTKTSKGQYRVLIRAICDAFRRRKVQLDMASPGIAPFRRALSRRSARPAASFRRHTVSPDRRVEKRHAASRVYGTTTRLAFDAYSSGFGVPTVLGGRIGYVTFGCSPVSDLRKAVILLI